MPRPEQPVVAVTGASGHVGAALLRELLSQGRRVRVLDIQPPPELDATQVDWRSADVTDGTTIRRHLEGVDTVIHLAAKISIVGDQDGRVWSTNVTGVRTTAEAALACGVRRFVHCSSIHAFDVEKAGGHLNEESPRSVDPQVPVYDRSKAAGEFVVREVIARGLDAVIVNPTSVIGPLDFGPSRMGRTFLALAQGRLPMIVAGGFDWVDVRDVASGIIAAERDGRTGENYLLPGHHASFGDIASITERLTGKRAPRLCVPWPIAQLVAHVGLALAGPRRRNELTFTPEALRAIRSDPHVDGRKARDELGHRPRPLEETIADVFHWFASRQP